MLINASEAENFKVIHTKPFISATFKNLLEIIANARALKILHGWTSRG